LFAGEIDFSVRQTDLLSHQIDFFVRQIDFFIRQIGLRGAQSDFFARQIDLFGRKGDLPARETDFFRRQLASFWCLMTLIDSELPPVPLVSKEGIPRVFSLRNAGARR
jgi:hypothetical protein